MLKPSLYCAHRTQVQELVLHRDPALLDEVVPLLISEFQVSRGKEGGLAGGW